jgi:glycosyltransferase involved in cell wall biosynthesis
MTLLDAHHRLVLLGYGQLRKKLEEQAQQTGIGDRVTFLDAVPPEELLSWVAGADVGVIPYQRVGTNHEYSTPNKLFECMHAGVPVVVNDLPELKRIVSDVGFGVVTDCSDPAAIAKAIEELTSDPRRWSAGHEAALAGALRYCWETQEQQILAALRAR